MVAIRTLKVASPAAQWMQRLPIGAKLTVILRRPQIDPATIEVEVTGQPHQVEAVYDALAGLGITRGGLRITNGLPNGHLKAQGLGLLEEDGQQVGKETTRLSKGHGEPRY